jgi:thiol-disulfide isomerase/thioredoxin
MIGLSRPRPNRKVTKPMPEMTTLNRRSFLGALAMTFAAAKFGTAEPSGLPWLSEGDLPSFRGATEWLNSKPLTQADLRGKVVLVNFWTYTCVNWRRTLPYVRAWTEKYGNHGLIVIGVHTPEFSFEHNVDNIRWALKDMKISYPIPVDSDYAIWRAFNNQYWPASYFIDAKGHIRNHQFGEGDYQRCEMVIQQLLAEAGISGFEHKPVSVEPGGAEVAADQDNLRSPETYVGYEQTQNFASPHRAALNRPHDYELPARLGLNSWALAGNWTVRKEAVALNQANGRIAYRFHARDLNLVMGPAVQGKHIRIRVLLDGRPPANSHGVDIDAQGNGTVIEQQLYQLIRQPEQIAQRLFEIEFLDAAVEAFDFTFG